MNKEQTPAYCPTGHSFTFSILFAILLAGFLIFPASTSAGCDPGQVADKFGTCCNAEDLDDCNVCFGTVNCNDGSACTIDECVGEDLCSHTPIAFNASATGTAPSACGQCDGTATVDAAGGTPPYSYLWSTGATTQSIGTGESGTSLCINAGGLQFIAADGDTFTADYYYNPGNPATTAFSNFAAPIAGTTDDSLYQSERNIVTAGGTMTYNIPVVNGSYAVELHFAELFYGVTNLTPPFTGKRKFDVSIEGVLVLDDYDINADVGPATAVIKSYTTTVSDGMLDIAFTSVVNRAKVNAICVKPSAAFSTTSGGLCAGTYSVTVTDANGCEATGEVTLNNPGCNDDNLCTTDECVSGECIYTPVICDDSDACTDDFCAAETGCYYLPHECNDADPCTDDLCDNATGCYYTAITCNDANDCTDDFCIAGVGCNHEPVNCDDNNACTIDACEPGTAVALIIDVCNHTPIDCNDSDECTEDACDNGICTHTEIPGCNDPCNNVICDDENDCTTDACEAGLCIFTAIICDDADECTSDACDNGQCVYTPILCDDGDVCTTDDCNEGCIHETINCDDSDACTVDACESGTSLTFALGGCIHTLIDCSDNDECTEDACDNGTCTHTEIPGCNDPCNNVICDDENDCTTNACVAGDCIYTLILCNDNNLCTQDACIAGTCVYLPINCDDGNACTLDFCNPASGCLYTPVDCSDNNPCTNDFCNPNPTFGGCFWGTITCNDNNACTSDACDNGNCVYTEILCSDDDPCTTDACYLGQCIFTAIACDDANECTTDACDNGQCVFTAISCNDNDACTIDTCDEGCINETITCNDNNECTTDECREGSCSYQPIPGCGEDPCANADCNDNNPCTSDVCEDGICINTVILCNDADACTDDACTDGDCVYTPILCDDNDACTTNSCDYGQCIYIPLACDDNDDCTTDACDSGQCVHIPVLCDDGDVCTSDNCVSGRCNFKPVSCDDNNACTTDACNAGCTNTPIDCNDNDACTQDVCNNGICGHTNICNPCTLEVISFTLVNSLSDLDIGPLEDGAVINLFYTPTVNVRANLCVEPVGSVKFNLNYQTYRIEGAAPYALAGDNPAGNYNKWNVSVGTYTITAIPFSGASATGTQGTAKTIHITVINQEIACFNNTDCDDNDACTTDECQSGQCSHSAIDCNDNDPCTADACNDGCIYTLLTCDDANLCTDDLCNSLTGCEHSAIAGCCLSAADCDDSDICTIDVCENNLCSYEAASNEPAYLHVVNTAKSWKKLKLGYSSTSLYTPKQNVIAGGNNTLCVTLRGNTATDWSRIQIRPQGSISSPVSLGSYGLGTSFTEICIPLAAFGGGVDFTQLTLIEIPYSNGANAFEIDIQKIEFRGGATPFLWFGNSKTDNKHDGNTVSALAATVVAGSPCGTSKMAGANQVSSHEENMFLNAYPNPFNERLNIEFSLPEDARVKLEIFNTAGQCIAQLFEGDIKANELNRFEFSADNIPQGMLIYKLQTEKENLFGKAVITR